MPKIEGYETIQPAIPRELRRVDPEMLAFLRLLWDMGARTVSQGHMIIKSALFENLANPEFLERSEEYIYSRLGKLRRIPPGSVESSLRFSIDGLWNGCDHLKIVRTYFPDGSDFPEPQGNIESLKVLFQMYMRMYAEYRK